MTIRSDCRHYLLRSTATGESVQRCRVSANEERPFACPESCLFFEARPVTGAGWTPAPEERMSNTADGLLGLPSRKRTRRGKKGRRS